MKFATLSIVVMLCLLVATPALAVSEGAPAILQPLLITSARAAALGGVTVVIEESGVSGWRNPGFLAFDRKWRATGTKTQLVPDLADDIRLRSLLVSAPLTIRVPLTVAAGYAKLDFGESPVINGDGTEGTSSEAYDRTFQLSASAQFWETVGAGITLEHISSKLTDPIPELNLADGEADAFGVSLGLGVRRRFTFLRGEVSKSELTVTPLAGAALLNWGGELQFNDEDQAEEMARHLHIGAGLRLAHEPQFVNGFFDLMRLSQASVAGYIERMTPEVNDDDERTMHYGCEMTAFGIVSYRFGHVDDPSGDITDNTHGWGVGVEDLLPFDVRLDYASFPQATDLDRVDRWDVMIAFDPRFLDGE